MKEYRIRSILVPTDFSPLARHALEHARRIADLTGARITLLNVVEPFGSAFGTSGMLGLASSIEERQLAVSRKRLAGIAGGALKRSRATIETVAVTGRIASMITKVARKVHADLIVMGTHGAAGFVENLLGSTTYRTASLSTIPLMSVHRKMTRSGYNHIVYPIREQSHAMLKFPQALKFARLFKASVHIMGLLRPEQKSHERKMRAACEAIRKRCAAHKIAAKTTFTFKDFFPEAVIRYAHARPGSLVIIVQDADFHLVEIFQGTFARKALHSTLSPVLMVPV